MPKIRGAILISPWLDLSISGTELTSRAVTVNESLMPVHLHEILGIYLALIILTFQSSK